MKYVCRCCGEVFDDADSCPVCRGVDFTTANNCKICGWEDEYEVCEDCMSKMATSENALEIGKEYTDEIKVNGLFAYAMTEKQIDEALHEWWAKKGDPTKAKAYCYEDKPFFAEWCARKHEEVTMDKEKGIHGMAKEVFPTIANENDKFIAEFLKCNSYGILLERIYNANYRKADEVRRGTAQEVLLYLQKQRVRPTTFYADGWNDCIDMVIGFLREEYGVEV